MNRNVPIRVFDFGGRLYVVKTAEWLVEYCFAVLASRYL